MGLKRKTRRKQAPCDRAYVRERVTPEHLGEAPEKVAGGLKVSRIKQLS